MIEISRTIAEFLMAILAALLWVALWGGAIAAGCAALGYCAFRGFVAKRARDKAEPRP